LLYKLARFGYELGVFVKGDTGR